VIGNATEYINALKYDTWELFHMIPADIKQEVIIQMDECMDKYYSFIWEGDWFKKIVRYEHN